MIIVLQVAGVGAVLIGLVAIGFGVPVKEFSFGNTLILVGTVAVCTGLILLGLSVVARELRMVARRLATSRPAQDPRSRVALPQLSGTAAVEAGPQFPRDQPMPPVPPQFEPSAPPVAPPWREEIAARARPEAAPEPEPAQVTPIPPPPPKKRNLLFSSSVRKEHERAQARTTDPAALEPQTQPPVPEAGEAPPASFEDAWPKIERARGEAPSRRSSRLSPAPAETNPGTATERAAPPPRVEERPTVTVLKSGVVDGMAYSLYSDGSIEAQMPEGMMRFASIDELRAHLDQRP